MATEDPFALIIIALSQDVHHPQRDTAAKFCESLKHSVDGWRACLRRLHDEVGNRATGRDEIKFWCLEVISHVVLHRYMQLTEEERGIIRMSLMVLVRDVFASVPQTTFIKTKVAVLLVRIIKYDYPTIWPTFFKDFLSILPKGVEVVDIFLRILHAIDEEIVCANVKPGSDESKQVTLIKDTMRDEALHPIVESLYGILVAAQTSQPALAKLVLETLDDYISWIHIDLIANEKFIKLFYAFLRMPHLQNESIECLVELVSKGMKTAAQKLELLKSLRINEELATLTFTSTSFAVRTAGLVGCIGEQLIEILESKEDGIDGASSMLENTMELAYRFMEHPDYRVANEVITLLHKFVLRMKDAANTSPRSVIHYRRIFVVSLSAMRYRDWYSFERDDDDEKAFEEFRVAIEKIFKNQAQANLLLATELVQQALTDALPSCTTQPFAKVEAAMKMLYLLGEFIKEDCGNEPYRTIIGGMLTSDVSRHSHARVSLAYFDAAVRFPRFIDAHPDILVIVLQSFMDTRGISHKNQLVRARSCYLLKQLVRAVHVDTRAKLRPHLDNILNVLLGAITPVLNKGFKKNTKQPLKYDDILNLIEVVSVLIGSHVTGDMFRKYFEMVLSSFAKLIVGAMAERESWLHSEPAITILAGKRLSQVVNAIACLSKHIGNDSKKVEDLLGRATELVIQVYIALPQHEGVRKKTLSFLHRMPDCLNAGLIPLLPTLLEALIRYSTRESTLHIMQLINQLIGKFRGALLLTLDALFSPVIIMIGGAIKGYEHVNNTATPTAAYSSDKAERLDIQRIYYTFLKDIVTCDLSPILSSPTNADTTPKVLDHVFLGLVEPPDLKVNQTCFNVLQHLIPVWFNEAKGEPNPTLTKMVFHDITVRSFQCALSPHFNIDVKGQEATAQGVLRDMLTLQMISYRTFDKPYLAAFGEFLATQLRCPHDIANEYCVLIHKAEMAPLLAHAKRLIVTLRGVARAAASAAAATSIS